MRDGAMASAGTVAMSLREAVEQAIASCGDQVRLAAAARLMRRIPGACVVVVGKPRAVDVAEHGLTEFAASPAVAGHVDVAGKGTAVTIRTCQSIVPIRIIADARHHRAALGQRGIAAQLVVRTVQIIDVLRDDDAFGVLPWPGANTVAGIGALGLRSFGAAEIGVPSLIAGAYRGCKLLAMGICTLDPAEVATLPDRCAGDEEGHVGCLRNLLCVHAICAYEQSGCDS